MSSSHYKLDVPGLFFRRPKALEVMPAEFVRQAVPFCLTEAEALELHAEMDFLNRGFVDLFAMSPARTRVSMLLDCLQLAGAKLVLAAEYMRRSEICT